MFVVYTCSCGYKGTMSVLGVIPWPLTSFVFVFVFGRVLTGFQLTN